MFPRFPELRRLEWTDRDAVTRFVGSLSSSHSDVSFIGVWAYDLDHEIEIGELHGNLVIKLIDYFTHLPVYSFVGRGDPDRTALALLDLAGAIGERRLGMVHEDCAAGLDPTRFQLTEEPDQADYLYSVDRLAELAGPEYTKARREISGFGRKHAALVTRPIDITSGELRPAILELATRCDAEKPAGQACSGTAACDPGIGLARARGALARLLGADVHADEFPAIGVFDGDHLVGYRILEIMRDGTAMSHFQAAPKRYSGIHHHLMREGARALRARGVALLNEEQDLGLPGLRFFKRSFRPIAMVKKFSVTDRAGDRVP
jgi:hypothetical protein